MNQETLETKLFSDPLHQSEREITECQIDAVIRWVASDDRYSKLLNRDMVEAEAEKQYFCEYRTWLEHKLAEISEHRQFQFVRECHALQSQSVNLSGTGRLFELQAKQQDTIASQISAREKILNSELKAIKLRFDFLIQQCDRRIAEVEQIYEEALARATQSKKVTEDLFN